MSDWIRPFLPALGGGALIGLSAGGLYLLSGRIAGVSGIFGDALLLRPGLWRWLFVVGLILAGVTARFWGERLGVAVPVSLNNGPLWLSVSGLLVGLGTRLSKGCTSGHGVCGLARFSVRSLAAVLVFMAAAGVTVYLTYHVFKVAS